MAEKWYNSYIAEGVGTALVITALAFGVVTFMKGCASALTDEAVEREKIIKGYILQEADLNGNGITDKFYVINGKVAIVELDGKPLTKSLDLKLSTK